MKRYLLIMLGILMVYACQKDDGEPASSASPGTGVPNPCVEGTCIELIPPFPVYDLNANFSNWSTSPYKLPYTANTTHQVIQGNTSGFGHSGIFQYGYDFKMCIGTDVLAARGGTVVHANDGTKDGNRQGTNLITILHGDGSTALYSHLTLGGVLVNVGDVVKQGDLIGKSGDTGNTGGIPHLHFSVHQCSDLPGLPPNVQNCFSVPVNFRNTEANPNGLGTGRCYTPLF